MASFDYNSVPLGEAGTGAAYLLPGSSALAGFNKYLDNQDKESAVNEKLKQAKAAQLAKTWKDNQLKIKAGTIFQPEINARANNVMQMGMELKKLGIDPTGYSNDPRTQKLLDAYQTQRQSVINDAELRDKIAEQAKVYDKMIAEKPEGFYDPESVAQYHHFLSGEIPLNEISAKGYQLPAPREAFNVNEAVDKLPISPVKTAGTDAHGVRTEMVLPDDKAHMQTAHDFVLNDPRMRAQVEKKIGMPITNLPDTTDVDAIKNQLDAYWRSKPNIPSLAAQGINTFGDGGNTNSNGVPDAPAAPIPGAPQYKPSKSYDDFITGQAKQLSSARKQYDQIVGGIKGTLDSKVHKENLTSWDFKYQNEMRDREKMGMERMRFSEWMKDKQNDEGETVPGNAGTYVPVVGTTVNKSDGTKGSSFTNLQKGATLFNTRMPQVDVTVQPSQVMSLDNKSGGRVFKNAEPIQMKVGGLKMAPVLTGLKGEDEKLNGQELSLSQLNDIVDGKHGKYKDVSNIEFKPMVYGLHISKDENGHTISSPIQIPYEDFKGGNTKKVNTKQFDNAVKQYQALLQNPEFLYTIDPTTKLKRKTTAKEKLDLLKQFYNVQE